MSRPSRLLPLLLVPFLTACASDPPATPLDLAGEMRERFDANVGDATGFTVVLGGYEMRYTLSDDTTSAERFAVSIVPTIDAVQDPLIQAMATSYLPNVPLLASTFAGGGGALTGPSVRDGAEVYAVDASGVAPDSAGADRAGLVVYVDAETFQIREVERTVRIDSLARPISSRLFYEDYRTVDGVTLPHRMRVRQEGLEQLLPEAARIREGGQLTLQREQIRQMPPSPSRAHMLDSVERRLRAITEGIEEASAEVTRLTVQRAGAAPEGSEPGGSE